MFVEFELTRLRSWIQKNNSSFLLTFAFLLSFASSSFNNAVDEEQCSAGFYRQLNGYGFFKCYKNPEQLAQSMEIETAIKACSDLNTTLLTVKSTNDIEDLGQIFASYYSHYYYWLGARATHVSKNSYGSSSSNMKYYWQDGTEVKKEFWCSGEPKGGQNLCTFYTTYSYSYSYSKCIRSGRCVGNLFSRGIICNDPKDAATMTKLTTTTKSAINNHQNQNMSFCIEGSLLNLNDIACDRLNIKVGNCLKSKFKPCEQCRSCWSNDSNGCRACCSKIG